MLYYFFSLSAAAAVLLINDHTSEANRWGAFFLLSASIGGLPDFVAQEGYTGAAGIIRFINHTFTPYGVMVFSLVYSGRMPERKARLRLKWLLLMPVAVMAFVTPRIPDMSMNYGLLLVWTAPYYLISCYWLLSSWWKESDRRKKRNRFVVTMIVVPTLLAVLALINVAHVISPDFDYFRYISLFIIYSLSVALLCTFLYGVLGVKLRFERDPMESTMHAVSTGAALLNHTIKNEIGKIAISSENLKRSLSDHDQDSRQHLQIIEGASEHMLAMVTRIHSQMKDIVLREEPCRLDELADECLRLHGPLLDGQGVGVSVVYSVRPVVLCDPVHMKEAIGNILRNAAEAISFQGLIEIRLDAVKRGVRLSIRDSGPGISSDRLSRVFEPFYSTKQGKQNFGLGLSYVYNVMQRSGGTVEISSPACGGTLVSLMFPRSKRLDA